MLTTISVWWVLVKFATIYELVSTMFDMFYKSIKRLKNVCRYPWYESDDTIRIAVSMEHVGNWIWNCIAKQ